jgi:murein DD-endopeptidase MepM/ murein hydrolase activator NlpD
MIFLTILPSKCKEKYFLRIFSCVPDILKTAFFIERKRVTMQNQEHPKESGKNLGFYAASGICLLTLVAAIGVGISGLGKESANEAQVSVAEETEPTGAVTSDLTVSEEDETSEQNVVTIGGIDTSSEESEETFASEEAEETATESQPDPAPSFALPVEGEILTEYSDGELVKNETLGEWRTHDGIDIAAAANTPVKAAADGTVTEVKEDPLWGMCVTISHDGGYQTFYQGLKSRVEVSEGAAIAVGEILGYVGTTAEAELSLDPHLHFAVQKDGAWVDPASVVSSGS